MLAFMSGVELLIRVVFSLGLVLGLIWVSARVVRRRGVGGHRVAASRASGGRAEVPFEVVARTGLTRTSMLTAVRFADQVVLVGCSDGQAPVVLAAVDASRWDTAAASDDTTPSALNVPGLAPFDAVDFLRSVTSRRPR